MMTYHLHLAGIPRLMGFPPPLDTVYSLDSATGTFDGVRPNNIEFALRLSSSDGIARDEQNGICHETAFPHVYVKLPSSRYRSNCFSVRQAFVLLYSGCYLDSLRGCGIPLDRVAWTLLITPLMKQIMSEINTLAENPCLPGNADRIDSLGWMLLREMALPIAEEQGDGTTAMHAVRKIASYYSRHYAEKIDLDSLICKHGLSRRAFFRCWASEYSSSPKQYQLSLRLHEAERLLSYGTSVAETALQTGFEDPSRFSRFFSRAYETTPSKYRRR